MNQGVNLMRRKNYTAIILSVALLMSAVSPSAMAESVSDVTEGLITETESEEAEALMTESESDWLKDLMAETESEEADALTTEAENPLAWYLEFMDTPLEDPEVITEGDPSISRRVYPGFMYFAENTFELPLYFIDGVDDLPYIELKDMCNLLVSVYRDLLKDEGYSLHVETDGPVAEVTRDNGYTMLIDYEKGTILFDDYDAFIHRSTDTCLLDNVATTVLDEDGNEVFLKRNKKGSYDRYGKEVKLNLADYHINLYTSVENGLRLMPLQTMGDFLLSIQCLIDAGFNKKAVFLTNSNGIRNDEGLTKVGLMYASGPGGQMSDTLAVFGYNELCLVMDILYGLKDLHGISSFDELFTETGYKDKLLSNNPDVKDGALKDVITFYLDDLHSGINMNSFRTYEPDSLDGYGLSVNQHIAYSDKLKLARNNAEHKITPYEEVGNTAYVTFDSFNVTRPVEDYYKGEYSTEFDLNDPKIDTIGLIIYAHEQITRKDSPIENVVLDMSQNGGGDIDAAVVAASWFLGEAEVSMKSMLTGAQSTSHYQADVNLDGKFDENDTVSDRNLYCLISPQSFSCGNLVPAMFKYSHDVTLIGQTSGGGSCAVLELTSAWGSFFQISSPNNLSHVKNGSYYEIDEGVEPDYCIDKPANFYNREALTDYINGLF